MLLATVAASAQPPSTVTGKKTQKTVARKLHKAPAKKEASKPAPTLAIAPVPAPPAPKTLAEMPAVPPKVTYQNGLLTIDAPNSTLGDVLAAVKRATGAEIDATPAYDRVVLHIGPGDPKDVLTSLLSGSKFDYIILGSAENPNAVTQVILTQRSNMTAEPTPAPRAGFVTAQPPAETEEESPDDEQESPQPQPRFQSPPPLVQPRTMPPDRVIPPQQPVTPDTTQNPNQLRTPQQLFEQLRQMEQQRAEQQKQQKQQNPQ